MKSLTVFLLLVPLACSTAPREKPNTSNQNKATPVKASPARSATLPAGACARTALRLIRKGYNEGGMKLGSVVGPFMWNDAFFDAKGNPGLRHRVAYVVAYSWDAEFKRNKPGTELRIGECIEGEPSKLMDANKDGILNLTDMKRVKPDRSR